MSFNIEDYFSGQSNENLVFYHKGRVDSDVINYALDSVEAQMLSTNDELKLRKKVYNVLVESLQNLYHHVDETPNCFKEQAENFGMFRIMKIEGGYKIITGNFVLSENIEALEEKIKRINSLSNEEVKELYKSILNNQQISQKGGGGLGLVDIARKTGNKYEYSFVKYNDEYSFFYLNILVNRNIEA